MAYFAPYLDSAGLHIPTFSDIQNNLITQAQSIFGQDIYLDNDSQDMQYIAAISMMIYDTMQMCQLAVNNQSPSTAVGTGLDSIVKLNGVSRSASSYSTCSATILGIAGTVISSGVVFDTSGYKWDLPANTTIGSDGVTDVTVTCETAGAIVADIGTISTISTPQYGWTAVTNPVAATPGAAVETDAELRTRQTESVTLPSQTVLEGLLAAVLSVSGVKRAVAYENTSGTADANTLPAHSICIVAEGGTDQLVADQIYYHKTPGCGTYGTTAIAETSVYGFTTTINFYRPTAVPIDVAVSVKALSGYSGALAADIQTYVADYLNSLQIGDDVIISSLWGVALQAIPNIKSPAFSITGISACRHGGTLLASDIVIAFNEAARGEIANVTVTVT